jgi:hypothetical protein
MICEVDATIKIKAMLDIPSLPTCLDTEEEREDIVICMLEDKLYEEGIEIEKFENLAIKKVVSTEYTDVLSPDSTKEEDNEET